jgi:hypothetical protein
MPPKGKGTTRRAPQNLRRANVFSFRPQDHSNPLNAGGPIEEGLPLDSVDTVNELVEQIDSYYGLPLNKQVLEHSWKHDSIDV